MVGAKVRGVTEGNQLHGWLVMDARNKLCAYKLPLHFGYLHVGRRPWPHHFSDSLQIDRWSRRQPLLRFRIRCCVFKFMIFLRGRAVYLLPLLCSLLPLLLRGRTPAAARVTVSTNCQVTHVAN